MCVFTRVLGEGWGRAEETSPPGIESSARERRKPEGFPSDEAARHERVHELQGWRRGSGQAPPGSGLATGCGLRPRAQPEDETHSAGLRPALGGTRRKQPAEGRLHEEGRKESGSPAKDTVPADRKTQSAAWSGLGQNKSDKMPALG